MSPKDSKQNKCCEKCKGSGSFNHTVGSHSDDRGGDSDLPCYCTENDCFHLVTDKKPCKCHLPQPTLSQCCGAKMGTKLLPNSAGVAIDCCSKCEKRFIPSPNEDWMEEEREAWKAHWNENYKGTHCDCGNYEMGDELTDYWLSRMAEKIEEARKEAKEEEVTLTLDLMKECRESGRAEERHKIASNLKDICNHIKTEQGLGRALANYINKLETNE